MRGVVRAQVGEAVAADEVGVDGGNAAYGDEFTHLLFDFVDCGNELQRVLHENREEIL